MSKETIKCTDDNIHQVIEEQIELLGNEADLNHLDVSNVTSMRGVFMLHPLFNGDLSNWDVSNVTNMEGMFMTSDFNGNISNWDVSNVTNMLAIFEDSSFNGDISNWKNKPNAYSQIANRHKALSQGVKTIKCTDDNIKQIVEDQIKLLGNRVDLNHLDVSNVTNMEKLFRESPFDGDISNWDVSSVTNMWSMFSDGLFNGDIGSWDVSSVIEMGYMFWDARVFNQDISRWDVSNVKHMNNMFQMNYDSENEISFNQDISKWDVSNVEKTEEMFSFCPIPEENKPKFKD